MSEFKKKAETKPTKIYRVRDFLELFKHGEADIKIHAENLDGREYWVMYIFWDYAESEYHVDKVPSNVLDLIVLRHLVLAGPEIELYV